MAKRGGFPGGGMPGNMANLMKQAQKMQRQMEEQQKELETKEFTAAAGGGAVEVTVSGKKEELYTLLKNSGYGDLITETINPSSLSAFVKAQMSENEDKLPSFLSGLINVFAKNTVSTRKYRK